MFLQSQIEIFLCLEVQSRLTPDFERLLCLADAVDAAAGAGPRR